MTLGILQPMSYPCLTLLFDPNAQPQCWNERMAFGEYAVLYSSNYLVSSGSGPNTIREPFCTVFSSLSDAEQHADQQVALHPTLRCRIYDHQGLGASRFVRFAAVSIKVKARYRRAFGART